jgi:dolichol kinase
LACLKKFGALTENLLKMQFSDLKRRIFHLLFVGLPIAYLFLTKNQMILLMVIGSLLSLFIEFLRLKHPKAISWLKLWSMRSYEKGKVAGYVYLFIGSTLAVILFSREIATAALLMLAIGDVVFGVVASFTPNQVSKKALPISVTWVVCFLLAILFVDYLIAAGGATGAVIANALPLKIKGRIINDNLTIPLYSGGFMWIISCLLTFS